MTEKDGNKYSSIAWFRIMFWLVNCWEIFCTKLWRWCYCSLLYLIIEFPKTRLLCCLFWSAPVKNTFIHFSDSEEEATGVRRRNSEPALWPAPCTNVTFSANLKGMGEQLVAHATGNCKPCSFFFFKEDGCRRGNSCSFCHLCSEDTARRQKRSGQRKARAVKRAVANQVQRGGLVPGSESSLTELSGAW